MKALLPMSLLLVMSLVASRAAARDDGINTPKRRIYRADGAGLATMPSRWYGWQVLAVDGVSVSLLTTSIYVEEGALAFTGATTFVFGAPAVHLSNRGGWRAGVSLGMRLTAPLLAAGIAAAVHFDPTCGEYRAGDCESDVKRGLAAALGSAMLITSAVDALALSYRSEASRPPAQSLQWTPTLALLPREGGALTASAGLVGIF